MVKRFDLSTVTSQENPSGTETTKARLYRSLKADIIGGVFDIGERLYENNLAEKYGVSKTPVREALILLQKEGLVELLPRVGYLTSRISIKDVQDWFNLRLIVETAAAELAATAISEESINYLASLNSIYEPNNLESYRHFLAENMAFHRIIAEGSGNQRLAEVITRVLEQMQRLLLLRMDMMRGGNAEVEEHRQIVGALRDRNQSEARRLMNCSIVNARQAVLESLINHVASRHI